MFNQTFAQSFIQLWVLCKIRLIDLQFWLNLIKIWCNNFKNLF
ncbi:hypothetical protein AO371_0179 [Moraxella catarrhalis]|nr:hypothetical protein AO371_0179 [Moraxella catarrhalis]